MIKKNKSSAHSAQTDNKLPHDGMTTAMREFIVSHRTDDVRRLALKTAGRKDIDPAAALEQIEGWQKARQKLPQWAANDNIIYPPHISMEQCSSEKTALYKADVCRRLCHDPGVKEPFTLTDLTGGFGVDFSYMARGFHKAVYVERQEHLCRIAHNNFKALGLDNALTVNAAAEDYLPRMPRHTVIFADPARRDTHGSRTYAVTDCTPDVLALRNLLLDKAEYVVLKLSPMLDIWKTTSDFGPCCGEVHIVSSGGECKELLLVLSAGFNALQRIFCVNDNTILSYTPQEEKALRAATGATSGKALHTLLSAINGGSMTNKDAKDGKRQPERRQTATRKTANGTAYENAGEAAYKDHGDKTSRADTSNNESETPPAIAPYLYEPDAAIMKAGCSGIICSRYGVEKIAPNSNLFVSAAPVENFPGRSFKVCGISTMNRRALKALLQGITSANITVRNFPLKPDELKKRLHLKDGGDITLFATTTADGTHVIIKTRRKDPAPT